MTDDPTTWWKSELQHADFSAPEVCRSHVTNFERIIRRRNWLEYGAGALAALLFGSAVVAALAAGEWPFAIAGTMVLLGIVFVIRHLRRHGSNLAAAPELDCRTHLLIQLQRQQALLRKVPQWYLAPLVPGICAIYGVTTAKVAEAQGWSIALQGASLPFMATALFFAFVAWLNLAAARKLDKQITHILAAD